MSEVQFSREVRAYEAFQKWIAQASEVRELFESAGLSIPAPLARTLGMSDGETVKRLREPQMLFSPMESPGRPDEAEQDWIWVAAKNATPSDLIPAILRGGPMQPVDVVEKIASLAPDVNAGSVYNAGSRLSKTVLEKTDEGWKLKNLDDAPVLFNDYVWGRPQVLQKYTLAAHRRMVILHLLKSVESGLMAMQLLEALKKCGFCKAPINKDLLKLDLKVLEADKKIRRAGESGKWKRI